jgi:hypothetical protein
MGEKIKVSFIKLEDGSLSKAHIDDDNWIGREKFTNRLVVMGDLDQATGMYTERSWDDLGDVKVPYLNEQGQDAWAYVNFLTERGYDKHTMQKMRLRRDEDDIWHWVSNIEENTQVKVTYYDPIDDFVSQAYVDENTLKGTDKHTDKPVELAWDDATETYRRIDTKEWVQDPRTEKWTEVEPKTILNTKAVAYASLEQQRELYEKWRQGRPNRDNAHIQPIVFDGPHETGVKQSGQRPQPNRRTRRQRKNRA